MKNKGFTLAEVLVAVIVIMVALLPIITVFSEAMRQSKLPQKMTVATMLAQDLLEEIKSKRFDENPSNPTAPGSLKPETGETRTGLPPSRNYDDVDDYNGYTESPPKEVDGTVMTEYTGYSRSVVVEYVREDNFDTVSTTITRFKRIRVTITWENGAQSLLVASIRGNY